MGKCFNFCFSNKVQARGKSFNDYTFGFKLVASLTLVLIFQSIAFSQTHYRLGSYLSEQVTVSDKSGAEIRLQKLISDSDAELNIVYIFGGGGMGHKRAGNNGGLWCPDSYEDLHIVRSLSNYYKDSLGIIPIAVPPVFHSELLGYEKGVFFSEKSNLELQKATMSFISSTQLSFQQGTIPVQPFYDSNFNFLISQEQRRSRNTRSTADNWHGAFRAEDETQHYGVPSLWLINSKGKVVAKPFRGNVYRPHGGAISIRYTLNEVVAAIDAYLSNIRKE